MAKPTAKMKAKASANFYGMAISKPKASSIKPIKIKVKNK